MNQVATNTAQQGKPPSLIQQVRGDIQRMEGEFASALPGHVKPEKFVRTVLTAVQSNPDVLRACTTAEGRRSLYSSAMKAAADGLLPDGRESAFVTFGGKDGARVQYMPMAQGLMKTMRNSGEIESIAARVVYTNDRFEFVMGDEEKIIHEPAPLDQEPGAAIGAYCVIRLKGGDCIREVMRKAEIEKVRNVSRAKNAGTWSQWWEEMARKTVLRRAYKYAPKSADVDQMLEHDNAGYDLDRHEAHNKRSAAAILNGLGSAAEPAHDPDTGEIIDGEYSETGDQPDESLEADRRHLEQMSEQPIPAQQTQPQRQAEKVEQPKASGDPMDIPPHLDRRGKTAEQPKAAAHPFAADIANLRGATSLADLTKRWNQLDPDAAGDADVKAAADEAREKLQGEE